MNLRLIHYNKDNGDHRKMMLKESFLKRSVGMAPIKYETSYTYYDTLYTMTKIYNMNEKTIYLQKMEISGKRYYSGFRDPDYYV